LRGFRKPRVFWRCPVRTQIIERARYRVPDILLCSKPLPSGQVVNTIPLAVIEILSPEDRTGNTLERFQDYAGIGVQQIVLMDPERFIAHRYQDGSLLRTEFDALPLPAGTTLPFPSAALFQRLRKELAVE
jgi:Uma2 family endonuclease